MEPTDHTPDVWVGKEAAFGLVATGCAAAQAECLRRIKESGAYKSLGLTWEDYCIQHLGMTRVTADEIIRNLRDYGKSFFRIRKLMRISPRAYRAIRHAVKDESLEIDGKLIPITPENAPAIRQAVLKLRAELDETRETTRFFGRNAILKAQHQMGLFVANLTSLSGRRSCTDQDRESLAAIARNGIDKLTIVLNRCAPSIHVVGPLR
jgi:hypothetical protein